MWMYFNDTQLVLGTANRAPRPVSAHWSRQHMLVWSLFAACPACHSLNLSSLHYVTLTVMQLLYSLQAGVSSCRRQHVERPAAPRHICTVTRGLQAASHDFCLFSFLPGHPDMAYLLLLLSLFIFLSFPVDLAIIDII